MNKFEEWFETGGGSGSYAEVAEDAWNAAIEAAIGMLENTNAVFYDDPLPLACSELRKLIS